MKIQNLLIYGVGGYLLYKMFLSKGASASLSGILKDITPTSNAALLTTQEYAPAILTPQAGQVLNLSKSPELPGGAQTTFDNVLVTTYPANTPWWVASGGNLGATYYGNPVYATGALAGAALDSPAANVYASIVAEGGW